MTDGPSDPGWARELYVCPSCGKRGATELWERRTFAVGDREYEAAVPVMTCRRCEFEWTDYRAEEIRGRARRDGA